MKTIRNKSPVLLDSNIDAGAQLQGLLNAHVSPRTLVFDLDSTLYDVRPRIQHILDQLLEHPGVMKEGQEVLSALKRIKILPDDWGLRTALIREGFESLFPHLKDLVRNHWVNHFFANHLLHLDSPYPGAREFLQKLKDQGHRIFYLTGRDEIRMKQGTIDSLINHGFPLSSDLRELKMKPRPGDSDSEFKVQFFSILQNQDGSPDERVRSQIDKFSSPSERQKILDSSALNQLPSTFFFENEPVNLQAVRQQHPWVQLIFFKSTHSRKASPPQDLPTIENYLFATTASEPIEKGTNSLKKGSS